MYRFFGEVFVVIGASIAVWGLLAAPDDFSWVLGGVTAAVGWLLRQLGRADEGADDTQRPQERTSAPRSRSLPEPPLVPIPPRFEIVEEICGRGFVFYGRSAPPRDVHVRVGKPIPGGDGRWLCPYQIQGLGPQKPQAAFGPDSLGALLMALHQIPIEIEGAAEVEGGFVTYRRSRRLGFGSACAVLGRRRRRRRGEIGSVVVSSPRPPIRSEPLETV